MVNSVCSFVWYRTRIKIYCNVYLRSRVLNAIYHIYVYVRNVYVHIVWYKATVSNSTDCLNSVGRDGILYTKFMRNQVQVRILGAA